MSAKADIDVKSVEAESGHAFEIVVRESGASTRHRVTVSSDELRRFGGVKGDPAALVEESFRFLLEREPKESILEKFEIHVIARYFPEYPQEITRRLDE